MNILIPTDHQTTNTYLDQNEVPDLFKPREMTKHQIKPISKPRTQRRALGKITNQTNTNKRVNSKVNTKPLSKTYSRNNQKKNQKKKKKNLTVRNQKNGSKQIKIHQKRIRNVEGSSTFSLKRKKSDMRIFIDPQEMNFDLENKSYSIASNVLIPSKNQKRKKNFKKRKLKLKKKITKLEPTLRNNSSYRINFEPEPWENLF
ncbi:rho gtpase-activating protein ren1 [Anaeramoeba flamelloides]|uniref:Rho gtpase-activating protein ren1 n=1 Tax=Anaeramoeba flamelloides TaxID=1746091 RepID=A0ABQ8YU80_9EUKA|nr:rho gtpase-activating protein ren1 [Anaeramoeba flamelloides]